MKKTTIALLLSVAVATPAASQTSKCGPHSTMGEMLTRQYGEQSIGYGVVDAGHIMEVWTNPETGSWTVVIVRSDGLACIVQVGESWTPVPHGDPA